MKLITLSFGKAKGYGGYSFLWGWWYCVWTRVYIKGFWTPFCIIKINVK